MVQKNQRWRSFTSELKREVVRFRLQLDLRHGSSPLSAERSGIARGARRRQVHAIVRRRHAAFTVTV